MNAKSSRRKRSSVADQYNPTDLSELLAPTATDQSAEQSENAAPAPTTGHVPAGEPSDTAEAPATQPAPRRRRGRPKKTQSTGATAPVNLRLPVSLLERLEDIREDTGKPFITIVLEAVAAQHTHLADLIVEDNHKRAQIQADNAASDGLFVYSAQRGPRAIYDEPTESRLWRTYQRNVDALNNLVETSGASDRNQLLLVALRAHLDPRS